MAGGPVLRHLVHRKQASALLQVGVVAGQKDLGLLANDVKGLVAVPLEGPLHVHELGGEVVVEGLPPIRAAVHGDGLSSLVPGDLQVEMVGAGNPMQGGQEGGLSFPAPEEHGVLQPGGLALVVGEEGDLLHLVTQGSQDEPLNVEMGRVFVGEAEAVNSLDDPHVAQAGLEVGCLVVVFLHAGGHQGRPLFGGQVQDRVDIAQAIAEGPAQIGGDARLHVGPGQAVLPGNLVEPAEADGIHLAQHAVVTVHRHAAVLVRELIGQLGVHVPAVGDLHVEQTAAEKTLGCQNFGPDPPEGVLAHV